MTGPYRSDDSQRGAAVATRDPGIVGDIISQFADSFAFYRELVQNSIDAGTSSIEIRIAYDEGAGTVGVIVRDRGCGMTRDILENQLLVLFRSTKERDTTKIGKFGIGFASVLAPDPELVIVQSTRDGRRLALHLARDLTYQLFDAGPATQPGTSVELVLKRRPEDVAELVRSSLAALERWCRHASVPIELTSQVPGEQPVVTRVDRPLAIDGALVQVQARSDDDQLIAVVGLTASITPYTGFFNHGLLLHETTQTSSDLIERFAVKVQDTRLGYTLSRDNVRRDAHFARALAFAHELARTRLPTVAASALQSAAAAGDHARWWQLARALRTAEVELASWCFPLVEPSQAPALGRYVAASKLGRRAWTSVRTSPVTRLLASAGVRVIQSERTDRAFLKALLAAVARCELHEVEQELTIVTPVMPTAEDEALLTMLTTVLGIAYRAPSVIVLAQVGGVLHSTFAIGGNPRADLTAPHLVDREQATASPFGRQRVPLVVSRSHPSYVAALAADPRAGAAHLARLLLNERGILDVMRSTAVLEHALDQLGIGADR